LTLTSKYLLMVFFIVLFSSFLNMVIT